MKFYKKFEPLLHLTDSKYSRIALTGGRGSLKTGHAIRGILIACTQKKMKVCCFRESAITIKDSVKSEIDSIIDLEFKDKGFTSTQTEITHINGSRIFFKGLKEVNDRSIESLKGISSDSDCFLIDEAQAVSRRVLEALIPTLRKKGHVLIVCYNRVDEHLPIEEALHLNYDDKTAPENTFFLEINYPEIAHLGFLSKEFLDEAELTKENKPAKYEELYLNKARNANLNKVVSYFSQDNVDSLVYHPEMPLYLSCDYNYGAMSWICGHLHCGNFYVIDEICMENVTTRLAALEFCKRFINHDNYIFIGGDASAAYSTVYSEVHNYIILLNTLKQEFTKVKNEAWADEHIKIDRLPRKNPPIMARLAKFNELILDNNGERHIFIDEHCKYLRHAMKYCRYTDDGKDVYEFRPKDVVENPNHLYASHLLDAVSYWTYNYST